MAHFKINEKDIFFILKDQLNYGELCKLEKYSEFDEEMLDMTVTQAIKFARTAITTLSRDRREMGRSF